MTWPVLPRNTEYGNPGKCRGFKKWAGAIRQRAWPERNSSHFSVRQSVYARGTMHTGDGEPAMVQHWHGATLHLLHETESLKRRQPLQDALEALQNANSNFHILDLYPILCADEICKFYNKQGVFLYRDEYSYMSIAAGYLARPILLAAVDRAIKASDDMSQARSNSK
jgi:SGNH domain (fused to AT3 domains)